MTDPDLVNKKLAFIESCVADLRRLAAPDKFDSDIKEQRFVEHTLQLAIQGAGAAQLPQALCDRTRAQASGEP